MKMRAVLWVVALCNLAEVCGASEVVAGAVKTQKTAVFQLAAVRTSNLSYTLSLFPVSTE
jgi:hypothetical protein